jgi:succinate dehydrogenase hydrophobic anchor subunit
VRRGGLALKLYENSLSLAFLLLFLVSITLHAISGTSEYNEEQATRQSEFLAIAAVVLLSIFLHQRGSPESKPVDSPHSETGTQ